MPDYSIDIHVDSISNKYSVMRYRVIYKLRCRNDVVYCIETTAKDIPHKDYYFEHQAMVEAMRILLGMADELKVGKKELVDYDIIWEE